MSQQIDQMPNDVFDKYINWIIEKIKYEWNGVTHWDVYKEENKKRFCWDSSPTTKDHHLLKMLYANLSIQI